MLKSYGNSDRLNRQGFRSSLPANRRTRLGRDSSCDLFELCSNRHDRSVAVIHLGRQRYVPRRIGGRVVLAVLGHGGQIRKTQQKQKNGQLVHQAKQTAAPFGPKRRRPITPGFELLATKMHCSRGLGRRKRVSQLVHHKVITILNSRAGMSGCFPSGQLLFSSRPPLAHAPESLREGEAPATRRSSRGLSETGDRPLGGETTFSRRCAFCCKCSLTPGFAAG
jgi:hypothetical protein